MAKRILFLAPGLVFTLLTFCEAHERPLDALCPKATTTVEMVACLRQRYEEADKALNQVYRQLMAKLEPARQEKFRAAQRAWVRFRDASAEFEASEAEGGSMYPLVNMATHAII